MSECLKEKRYLFNMDAMPNADSKNSFASGPVVNSDTSPAIVFNISNPLLPTNTLNAIRISSGDNGILSNKHDVDGLELNTAIATRTIAALTSESFMNFSIIVAIDLVISSFLLTKTDMIPISSIILFALP